MGCRVQGVDISPVVESIQRSAGKAGITQATVLHAGSCESRCLRLVSNNFFDAALLENAYRGLRKLFPNTLDLRVPITSFRAIYCINDSPSLSLLPTQNMES